MINPFKVLYLLALPVLIFFTACENDLTKVEKISNLEVSLPIETGRNYLQRFCFGACAFK